MSAARYCSHYLPPVSTTQVELVAKFAAGVVDTGGKFAAGVVDTGGNFATGVIDTGGKFATGGAPWLANISANFRKNLEWLLNYFFSGAWGKVIHEKNLKQKISWHCPFEEIIKIASVSGQYQNLREVCVTIDDWR